METGHLCLIRNCGKRQIMGKNKLKGKDLKSIELKLPNVVSLAINLASKHLKHHSKAEKLAVLAAIKADPESYRNDPVWGLLAERIAPFKDLETEQELTLKQEAGDYRVFGKQHISDDAETQMDHAMRLPIVKRGALMPDAHLGYGLPIGSVVATENAVIPYGVGMDIGCRMCLTVYNLPAKHLVRYAYQLTEGLREHTAFGQGVELANADDDAILERPEFRELPILRKLHFKAGKQMGSSGSGNHFVEFGEVALPAGNQFGLAEGTYVGLLSHSGSRGLGAHVAQYYTRLAREKCFLPKPVQSLAWLDLDREEGMEYWLAMNLAGDYAQACHDHIHRRLAKVLGEKPVVKVENHHNFAWKEMQPDGKELIVHRKGATPAKVGELGIIPGSMTAPGFIVEGKGEPFSLQSASHGAGRQWSRSKAKRSVTMHAMRKMLRQEGITLLGGDPEEAPQAYKSIESVIKSQKDLVSVLGTFQPKIVRMDKRRAPEN